jgi:tRNA G10  N-methylase Trm11
LTVELIDRVVREKHLDGIVWDTPYNLFEKERKQLNQLISELIKAIRTKIGDKIIMLNMANPMNHMETLDIGSYKNLPIDSILIQNYDSGDDYL